MSTDEHPTMLQPGARVGDRLEVIRCIGAGGLGEVYEVEHRYTRHRRALKVLRPRFRQDAEIVDRFLREASAAGRIGNPHIVETFDAGHLEDGSPFIVMEFLEGRPLDAVLHRHGRVDAPLAAAIMCQVCDGVQAAHDAGVIHRDLKPENLFLSDQAGSAFVKVLDFGVSKFQSDKGEDLSMTKSGMTMGTPLYMAPEQLRSSRDADARSDVYALGVILYRLLSGTTPFDAVSYAELVFKVMRGTYAPLNEVDGQLPMGLSAIASKAMHMDPGSRFQSARDLGEALAPFAESRSVADLLEAPAGAAVSSLVSKAGAAGRPGQRATPHPSGHRTVAYVPRLSQPKTPSQPAEDSQSIELPRRSRGPWVLGAVMVVAVGGAGAWLALGESKEAVASTPTTVPTPAGAEASGAAVVATAVAEPSRAAVVPSGSDLGAVTPSTGTTPAPEAVKAVPEPPPPESKPEVEQPTKKRAANPKKPGGASKPAGTVDVNCLPVFCRVVVDGKTVGETPVFALPLAPGQHRFELVNSATAARRSREVTVKSGEKTKLIEKF